MTHSPYIDVHLAAPKAGHHIPHVISPKYSQGTYMSNVKDLVTFSDDTVFIHTHFYMDDEALMSN